MATNGVLGDLIDKSKIEVPTTENGYWESRPPYRVIFEDSTENCDERTHVVSM